MRGCRCWIINQLLKIRQRHGTPRKRSEIDDLTFVHLYRPRPMPGTAKPSALQPNDQKRKARRRNRPADPAKQSSGSDDHIKTQRDDRAANAVHIRSREQFIRSMLLFKEGDLYRAADAAECARLLRGLGIMNPVSISAREIDGGVEVTVETHDQWSLQIGADAGLSGNRGSFGVQIQEENLAGWG
jgi:hypothetical protein